jgi:hypothetical protein
MSDEDLIRRNHAIAMLLAMRGPVDVPRTEKAIMLDEGIDRCIEELRHFPAVQTFTAADLSWPAQIARIKAEMFTAADLEAAFRLALEMAGDACMIVRGQQRDTMAMISAEKCAAAIRAMEPPADLTARVEGARK